MRFHKVFRLYFFVCPFNILIVIHFYDFFKYFRTNFLKNIGCVTELKHFFTFSKRGCAFLKLNGAWIAFFLPMRYTIGSEVNNDGFSGKRKTSLRFKKGKRNDAKTSGGQVGDSAEKENGRLSRYFLYQNNRPFLVRSTGIAPLAARPAQRLSIVAFAANLPAYELARRQSVLLPQNGSLPRIPLNSH